ncbi:MAG: ABC transporter permease [Gemmatimonadota bacterium]
MPLFEAVRLALGQIRVQKLKSFFTLLGVTIGVMFLVAVVSIVEGMSKYVEEDFIGRMIGTNTFTLRRWPDFSGPDSEAEWRDMQRWPLLYSHDARYVVDRLPKDVKWAIETDARAMASSPYAQRPRQATIYAVEGDYFQIKNYDIVAGRAIAQQEYNIGANVVVIGDEVATFFFPDLDPIGRELRISGVPYTVVGRIEKQGSLFGMSMDRLIIGPLESGLGRITNPRGDIDGMMLKTSSTATMFDGMELVREAMRARRHLRPALPDNFSIETSESALEDFNEVKGVMTIAGTALPMIGLIVGGMVIMNIMLVAVAERTREIGIRKSLGARRKDILRQFMVEAATLSTLGAVVGIGLGLGAAWLIQAFTPLPAAVAPWSLVVATLLGLGVGIVSGVYPARRASRLDPIEALRQE